MPETVETIRFTADVVAVTPDRRVLLIERGWDPYEGHWALPGGHVDPGETSRDAAARELVEETGVRVAAKELQPIGTWDTPGRDPRGRYVTVAYLAEVPASTEAVAGDDARNARWFFLDDLPADLAFDHAEILQAAADSHQPREEALAFREGEQARYPGGVDVQMSFTHEETAAIGGELGPIADAFHSALWALAILRTGHVRADQSHRADARPERPAGPDTWYTVINDLDHRLLPRIEGIRDAAMRAHTASGGSVGQLARAMDVARATAQYRREALLGALPSTWETWASAPQH